MKLDYQKKLFVTKKKCVLSHKRNFFPLSTILSNWQINKSISSQKTHANFSQVSIKNTQKVLCRRRGSTLKDWSSWAPNRSGSNTVGRSTSREVYKTRHHLHTFVLFAKSANSGISHNYGTRKTIKIKSQIPFSKYFIEDVSTGKKAVMGRVLFSVFSLPTLPTEGDALQDLWFFRKFNVHGLAASCSACPSVSSSLPSASVGPLFQQQWKSTTQGARDPSWVSKLRTISKQPVTWYHHLLSWMWCNFPDVLGLVISPTVWFVSTVTCWSSCAPRLLWLPVPCPCAFWKQCYLGSSWASSLCCPQHKPGTHHQIQTLYTKLCAQSPLLAFSFTTYKPVISKSYLSLVFFTAWLATEKLQICLFPVSTPKMWVCKCRSLSPGLRALPKPCE